MINSNWEYLKKIPNAFFVTIPGSTAPSPLAFLALQRGGDQVIERLISHHQLINYITPDNLCKKVYNGEDFFNCTLNYMLNTPQSAKCLYTIFAQKPSLIDEIPLEYFMNPAFLSQVTACNARVEILGILIEHSKFLDALTGTILVRPLEPGLPYSLLSSLAKLYTDYSSNEPSVLEKMLTKKPQLIDQIPLSKLFYTTAKQTTLPYCSILGCLTGSRSGYPVLRKFTANIDKFCKEITAEALFSFNNSPQEGHNVFYSLAWESEGAKLIQQILARRPDIMAKVPIKHLTDMIFVGSEQEGKTSIFNLLTRHDTGIEVLRSLIQNHPEIAKNITIDHLLSTEFREAALNRLSNNEQGRLLLKEIFALNEKLGKILNNKYKQYDSSFWSQAPTTTPLDQPYLATNSFPS